jgi:hypothetical protein
MQIVRLDNAILILAHVNVDISVTASVHQDVLGLKIPIAAARTTTSAAALAALCGTKQAEMPNALFITLMLA